MTKGGVDMKTVRVLQFGSGKARLRLAAMLLAFVPLHVFGETPEEEIKRAYRSLIEAENRHDLPAVRGMVWDSGSTLFVAKAPVGWHGYWGINDVLQHLRDMYQGTFRIDPIYGEEKVVFLKPDIGETYAPVKITVAYAGQNPGPRPFIMVLLWVKTQQGWKMATDIPIPVPPDPAAR
jgi:ketosteroid isomerase-like protein